MIHVKRPKVFFACDTGSSAYAALRQGLTVLLTDLNLDLLIFDREIEQQGAILEKVERQIRSSLCVVADVGCDASRAPNANVMLEIGLARALNRPMLLLLQDPSTAPSNLHGRDFVKYPECLQVGTSDYGVLSEFLKGLGRGLLGGRDIRIFSSRSGEYLEVLRNINELPGQEWYVGPELRAFLRPQEAENRWLREVRRIAPLHMHAEVSLRAARRSAFEANLLSHGCIDVYPLSALELQTWRGMNLSQTDRIGFLSEAMRLLRSYPMYQVFLVDTDNRQKYWIKETKVGAFVVFEGWDYIDVTSDRPTGGLVMTDPDVVASFRAETEKLIDRAEHDRDEVLHRLEALVDGV